MNVRPIKLLDTRFKDFHSGMVHWDYEDFVGDAHRDWKKDWISFDSLLADDERSTIWCGLTSFAGDIFYAYDRKKGKFRGMDFQKVGDRYDAKFHRALLFGADGEIWAATSLLHDIDRYWDAPGGAIVRFDPRTDKTEIVARPMPHLYIQGLTIDRERGILYGVTLTPERAFRYDIATGKVTDLGPTGSGFRMAQGATLAVDRTGACWGTWGLTRAWLSTPAPDEIRLWRYHPDRGRIEYLKHGLPRLHGAVGTALADEVHTGPDGAVYMGTGEGLLCRIDPESYEVKAIAKPGPARRLAALANGSDGKLYGTAGNDGAVIFFSYDPRDGKVVDHGIVADPQNNERAWHIHNLAICRDGTIYAGENDNPYRSSYLYEITGVFDAPKGAAR